MASRLRFRSTSKSLLGYIDWPGAAGNSESRIGKTKLSAFLLRLFLLPCLRLGLLTPKPMPRAMYEHILQRRLAHAERLNFSRESLDYFRHEVMSVFNFEPDVFAHDSG